LLNDPFSFDTLKAKAQTGKPVIISMGYGGDIKLIKKIFKNNSKIFLYCVADYPTKIQKIDFKNFQKFDGFSDHTEGNLAPLLFALKSKNQNTIKYLEKHVSVNESVGPDKPFSISLTQYSNLIKDIKNLKFTNF
jgi:sialic acid synthase SpsE